MKRKDLKELRQKSISDLIKKKHELNQELAKTKIERSVKQVKNTSSIRNLRDDIARVMTFIREKELLSREK